MTPPHTPTLSHSLTDEHSHHQPGHPLLFDLLDDGLGPGRRGLAHDREGVDVSDRADGGGGEPGQAQQGAEGAQCHDEQQVQVEARALHKTPLLLAHYQPGEEEREGRGEDEREKRDRGRGERRG